MTDIPALLEQNRSWAERVVREDPDFFNRLSHQQSPRYLWSGCSDSRVPANQIPGLDPGEVFVHRNVANVLSHGELNAIEQALNVCQTTVVRDAWARGQALTVHGWVYAMSDGRVRELKMDVSAPGQIDAAYQAALAEVASVATQGRRHG